MDYSCRMTHPKALFTSSACWATSPPILADSDRYWLSGPATISSNPGTLMLLLLGGGGGVGGGGVSASAVGGRTSSTSTGGGGRMGVGGCDCGWGAARVRSKRSTRFSRRSQMLSKCSVVGLASGTLSEREREDYKKLLKRVLEWGIFLFKKKEIIISLRKYSNKSE